MGGISDASVAVLEGLSEISIDCFQISTRRFEIRIGRFQMRFDRAGIQIGRVEIQIRRLEIQIGRAEMAAPFQRIRAGHTGIVGLRFGFEAGYRFSWLGPNFTERP